MSEQQLSALGDFAGGTTVLLPAIAVLILMFIGYWFFTKEDW